MLFTVVLLSYKKLYSEESPLLQKWFLVESMQMRRLELASGKTDDRGEGRRGSFYSWRIKKYDKGWRIERKTGRRSESGERETGQLPIKEEIWGKEQRYLEENLW